jgi:hypothetical protein
MGRVYYVGDKVVVRTLDVRLDKFSTIYNVGTIVRKYNLGRVRFSILLDDGNMINCGVVDIVECKPNRCLVRRRRLTKKYDFDVL